MTPERLTGLDASFLYMETPTLHMHVAMAAVFDPSTVPGGYSFRRIRQLINDRIPLAPVFQRRLVEVPMRLGHPVWVDDPEFDIDNHLRRAALPSPGGMRELGDFAADVISRQLHRDRPLWEMWIVEGLEDGKIALVVKMHHSTIDGVSGAELLGVLFDLEPEPARDARADGTPARLAHPLRPRAGLAGDGGRPGGAVRRRAHGAAHHPEHLRRAPDPPGPHGQGRPAADRAAHLHQRRRARPAPGRLRRRQPGRRQGAEEQDGHDGQRRGARHVRRRAAHLPAGRRRAPRHPARLGGARSR